MPDDAVEMLREALSKELEVKKPQRWNEVLHREILEIIDKNRKLQEKEGTEMEREALKREQGVLEEALRALEAFRAEKILRMVLEGVEAEGLLEKEKNLYRSLATFLRSIEEHKKVEKRLIMVSAKIPAFVGVDGLEYGPFEPGDIVLIHEEDFQTLKKEGLVKEVEESVEGDEGT
jgi:DNA replication initiation complex subunit (GINS family)